MESSSDGTLMMGLAQKRRGSLTRSDRRGIEGDRRIGIEGIEGDRIGSEGDSLTRLLAFLGETRRLLCMVESFGDYLPLL